MKELTAQDIKVCEYAAYALNQIGHAEHFDEAARLNMREVLIETGMDHKVALVRAAEILLTL